MITAPYNFVPLNRRIYIPSWSEKISQDIPFSDSEDGYIKISFTNTTIFSPETHLGFPEHFHEE